MLPLFGLQPVANRNPENESLSASILEPLSIESLSDPVKDTCAIRAGGYLAAAAAPQSSALAFFVLWLHFFA